MADKPIGQLNPLPLPIDTNGTLFVAEQGGAAYKVTGRQFIDNLTTELDGHGGIKSITYTAPVSPSLTGTMTITLADDSTVNISIQNGKGILSITDYWKVSSSDSSVPSSWSTTRESMTATNKYLWHYQHIAYNDGTSIDTTKTVVGVYGDKGDASYVWIRYASVMPTSDSDIGSVPDNWMGIYSGTASTAPTHYTDYDWFEIKGETGDPGVPATVVTNTVTYQISSSGTDIPSDPQGWSPSVPAVPQGYYLWTRTEIVFNDDTTITSYSVGRFGLDGSGSVSTVNNVGVDSGTTNINLTGANIPKSPSDSRTLDAVLDEKQNTLTFDSVPAAGSTNPVTSAGIRSAIGKCDCIILGNSWVTGGTNAGFTVGGWGNYFSTYYTKGTIFNGAASGAKVTSGDYLNQFNAIATGNDISAVGLVLISGFIGCDASTFASAFGTLISTIRTALPKARIIAVCPDCSTDATMQITNMALNAVVDSACLSNGVTCLFLQNDVRYNVNWFGGNSNFHVNPTAAQKLARMIAQYVDCGNMSRFTDIEEAGSANAKMLVRPDGTIGVQLYPYNASGTTVSGTGNIYTIPSIVLPGAIFGGESIPATIRIGNNWTDALLIGSNGVTNVYYYGTFTGQLRNVNFTLPQDFYALKWLV